MGASAVTRLHKTDVQGILDRLHEYDIELSQKTGRSLMGLACYAAGVDLKRTERDVNRYRIGVIPVTSGKGLIEGFCEAVLGIVSHLGFDAFKTNLTDVAGLAEAVEQKAHAVMLSDDDCFLAIDMEGRKGIDNSTATGKGYAAGLDLMAGGLDGKHVLVIGCGPVGSAAAETCIRKGAHIAVFDTDPSRCFNAKRSIERNLRKEIRIENELETALGHSDLIIEATPGKNIIGEKHIKPNTYIGAPGIPIGLDVNAKTKIGERLLHDPLQIGVATMAVEALKSFRGQLR
jgi:pyrrolysine biosynthesis protein PylD